MLRQVPAFSSFSVDDLDQAEQFYGETLDLDVHRMDTMDVLELHLAGDHTVVIYPKPDHVPATFTVLNFAVGDLDGIVTGLTDRGIRFEHYEGEIETDDRGISRGEGPRIAWFKDPAGNILSVLEPG